MKNPRSKKLLEVHPDEFPKAEYLYREAVGAFLEADDDYWILDDMSKDVLASVITEVEKAMEGKVSEAKLERLARNHPEWKAHKDGLYAARRNRGQAKARFMKAEKYCAILQSAIAYKRDEMTRLHG